MGDIDLLKVEETEKLREIVAHLEKLKERKEKHKNDCVQELELLRAREEILKTEVSSYKAQAEKLNKLQAEVEESKKVNCHKKKIKKKVIKHVEVTPVVACHKCENLQDEIGLKKSDLETINDELNSVNSSFKDVSNEQALLKEKIAVATGNYESLKCIQKNEEGDANNLIEELEEEKMVLVSKLAILKSGQNHDQGSSLFIEVERDRQALLQVVKQLKIEKEEFDITLNNLNLEHEHLMKTIIQQRKTDIDAAEVKEIETTLLENNKTIYSAFNELISYYKKRPEKPKIINVNSKTTDFNFVNPLINEEKKDTGLVKTIHVNLNLALVNQSHLMCKANNELGTLKKELKKHSEILKRLKLELLEIEAKEQEIKSTTPSAKKVRFEEEKDEE